MYICHIALKTGYSKYEIDICLQHKKNPDLEINMPENKSLSFFFFFKTIGPAGSLAQASDPAGHKRVQLQLKGAKLASYCSSELNFTWIVTHATKKCMQNWITDLEKNEGAATMLKACWLVCPCSSVPTLFPLFSVCVGLLRSALCLRPFLSIGFSFSILSSVLQILALKQAKEMALQLLHTAGGYWLWGKKTMATLVLTSFSLLLLVFFSSLSLLLCSAFLFLFLFSQLTNINSFCSLRFISTPSILFSFFLLLPLFLLLLPTSPWRWWGRWRWKRVILVEFTPLPL